MTYILLIAAILTSADQSAPKESPPVPMPAEQFAWPKLPRAITSFGTARAGDVLYVYGGHHGEAHRYSREGQSGELLALDLTQPVTWKLAAEGPRLQGLALVAHGGKLYRTGGFAARNDEGADQDLWSSDEFAMFDPATGKWSELARMPTPRSSFDAIVLDGTLYVVGGWAMRGGKETTWAETALACDLTADKPKWRELPPPPFKRRALSVGALEGKIFVVGGMRPDGKVTTATAIFDAKAQAWSEGPKLPGEPMEGFGTASCTLGGQLFVSTSSGQLLRLSADAKSWTPVAKLKRGRFFHGMQPLDDSHLIFVAGANMEQGRYADVEVVEVPRE